MKSRVPPITVSVPNKTVARHELQSHVSRRSLLRIDGSLRKVDGERRLTAIGQLVAEPTVRRQASAERVIDVDVTRAVGQRSHNTCVGVCCARLGADKRAPQRLRNGAAARCKVDCERERRLALSSGEARADIPHQAAQRWQEANRAACRRTANIDNVAAIEEW